VDLDLEELAAVIELLDKSDFTDFRYEKGDLRIAVRRGGPPLTDDRPAASVQPEQLPAARPAATPAQQIAVEPRPAAPSSPVAADEGTLVVRSPMLGTFYRSPKPGEPAFVEIGDKVDPDAVVGIVEVMKLMNSVPAGVSGEIVAVHARNGELVEFDQPLFTVRPIL